MNTYMYEPSVNETQEFIEIANDFANPLDIVREAISNAYDAKANNIQLLFNVVKEEGESIFKIDIIDDGNGMTETQMKAFFDLGNSTRKDDPNAIGEKGHGTKVYFNSKKIKVTSHNSGKTIIGEVNNPYSELHAGRKPIIHISITDDVGVKETKIEIWGYNNNRRDKFTHEYLKDHIRWFTKHGGIDVLYDKCTTKHVKLFLKGLDKDEPEELEYGHYFPDESISLEKLLDNYDVKAPDYYCKRITKTINLKSHPEIAITVTFSIEGKYVKYSYNNMIRRSGYTAPNGSYTMQERYGLWLCKDFIPIQRKNEWISIKGQEYTRLHAFVNCQHFKLTANRGSIENTPSELLADIENSVRQVFSDLVNSDDWNNIDWLEDEVIANQTIEREKRNFEWRSNKIKKGNIATYEDVTLIEPQRESGVLSLFLIVSTKKPELFPFTILDYDTHEGIDVIVKGDKTTPIVSSRLFYVEFKYILDKVFNHAFDNLHSIICWDTSIKNDDEVFDLKQEARKMIISQPSKDVPYTTYMLFNPKIQHQIQVYVLKDYFREKLGISFRLRTTSDSL